MILKENLNNQIEINQENLINKEAIKNPEPQNFHIVTQGNNLIVNLYIQ